MASTAGCPVATSSAAGWPQGRTPTYGMSIPEERRPFSRQGCWMTPSEEISSQSRSPATRAAVHERAVSEFALDHVVAATLAVYERLSATSER
jgi:hypothetical protein